MVRLTIEDGEFSGEIEVPYRLLEEVYVIKENERKLFSRNTSKLAAYNGYVMGIEYEYATVSFNGNCKPLIQLRVLIPYLNEEVLRSLDEVYENKEQVIKVCARKNMEALSIDKALKEVEVFVKKI